MTDWRLRWRVEYFTLPNELKVPLAYLYSEVESMDLWSVQDDGRVEEGGGEVEVTGTEGWVEGCVCVCDVWGQRECIDPLLTTCGEKKGAIGEEVSKGMRDGGKMWK